MPFFGKILSAIVITGFGLGVKKILQALIQVMFIEGVLVSQGVTQEQEQIIVKGDKVWAVLREN